MARGDRFQSKGARFRSRLARDGTAADVIARMVSPIGVPGIASKWPARLRLASPHNCCKRLRLLGLSS